MVVVIIHAACLQAHLASRQDKRVTMIMLYGWQAAEKDQVKDRVKAETVKALLAVVDSFEMAKGSLKPESEGEKKIDGAYQVSLCALCARMQAHLLYVWAVVVTVGFAASC